MIARTSWLIRWVARQWMCKRKTGALPGEFSALPVYWPDALRYSHAGIRCRTRHSKRAGTFRSLARSRLPGTETVTR